MSEPKAVITISPFFWQGQTKIHFQYPCGDLAFAIYDTKDSFLKKAILGVGVDNVDFVVDNGAISKYKQNAVEIAKQTKAEILARLN